MATSLGLAKSDLLREKCFIAGKWQGALSHDTFPVINPFDGKKVGTVPKCGREETKQAIAAAHKAFPEWRKRTAKDRSDVLWAYAHLIDQHKEDLARLMTLEQGKPLTESRNEISYANSFIKWFAEEGRRVYGDIIPSNAKHQHLLVIKQPIGVVAIVTPWNFPAAMITRKIAPALAVGCTVVVKPAEATPLTALALAKLAEEAGFPPGVINVVTGVPQLIGDEMTENAMVSKLSFTGSTAIGKLLMAKCAATLKKITLELGGNAPFIVFDDADIDEAVRGAIATKFRNSGQTCVCANRFLIQQSIFQEFSQKFTAEVAQLKMGNGLDKDVQQGPLINESALNKVTRHVEDALSKGAVCLTGGKPYYDLFYQPTVLTNVTRSMLVTQEETFGPVAPLISFETEEEAIQLANDTPAGLAAYFYSQNIARIWRVAENIETGMVGINTGIISTEVAPFGGVKQSGMGREGSKYGVEPYLEIKYLCMSD